VIPAWLVLLGALVVIADAVMVAVFMVRWERRTPAPRRVPEVAPSAAGLTGWPDQHSATPRPPARQPTTSEQAETRAGALSS
jgi:predicted lipid-binding transport protein (Tim44 family)